MRTNALDGVSHSPIESRDHALVHSVDDSDAPCDMSNMDDGDGTNAYAPNTYGALCNDMDATILANNPSRKANASIPTMVPKTNRRSMDDRYILAQ